MKYRYIGFSWPCYYPGGGECDVVCKSNDIEEVKAAIAKDTKSDGEYHGGSQILDCETGEFTDL